MNYKNITTPSRKRVREASAWEESEQQEVEEGSIWICRRCTFHNHIDLLTCEICEAEKVTRSASMSASSRSIDLVDSPIKETNNRRENNNKAASVISSMGNTGTSSTSRDVDTIVVDLCDDMPSSSSTSSSSGGFRFLLSLPFLLYLQENVYHKSRNINE
jgi:hypothetical protein